MAVQPFAADHNVPTTNDRQPAELIDTAIQHIGETTNAQHLNFLNADDCARLERRRFQRFLIADGPWSFGLWRRGDDIDLFFLTHDSENRWAEVLTEALGIEVGAAVLREATKDGTMDLGDERLCHFRDGRRTQYWFLRNASIARARIVLHYCKIGPEWIGQMELTGVFKDTKDGLLPEWPEDLPKKSYTPNVEKICFLKAQCNRVEEGTLERTRQIYTYVRSWAELNDLWKPNLVNPTTLWCAIAKPIALDKIDADATAESMFVDTLRDWASESPFPRHLSPSCITALRDTAKASLKDVERTLTSVRAARLSMELPDPSNAATAPPPQGDTSRDMAQSASKFRDARSVLNRLRYDASHSGIAYDVGYVDRFEGIKWLPLTRWGGKRTEEEDFIPEHRVRQIVRAEDGVAVWDREKRIDRTGDIRDSA